MKDTKGLIFESLSKCKTLDLNVNADNYHLKQMAINALHSILCNGDKLDQLLHILSDEDSQKILQWRIQFKVAYLFDESVSDEYNQMIKKYTDSGKIERVKDSLFSVENYLIDSEFRSVFETWELEAYRHEKVPVKEGDIVISGGSFRGESSIWFADKVKYGKVYAFEPSQMSFDAMKANIERNNLEDIIIPVNAALGKGNGEIFFQAKDEKEGPGSWCVIENGTYPVDEISIDRFVAEKGIEHVDFLKLDVEGMELAALQGARQILQRDKPRLAVCLYHKGVDLFEIPLYIHKICPDYKIYLSQKVDDTGIVSDWNQLVMFASAEE